MEDLEKYFIDIDLLNPGDFEVKKSGWIKDKKVNEEEREEVFLFFLNKALEKNPGIKNKLFKGYKGIEESQIVGSKEEGCGDEDCCHSN